MPEACVWHRVVSTPQWVVGRHWVTLAITLTVFGLVTARERAVPEVLNTIRKGIQDQRSPGAINCFEFWFRSNPKNLQSQQDIEWSSAIWNTTAGSTTGLARPIRLIPFEKRGHESPTNEMAGFGFSLKTPSLSRGSRRGVLHTHVHSCVRSDGPTNHFFGFELGTESSYGSFSSHCFSCKKGRRAILCTYIMSGLIRRPNDSSTVQ